MAETSDDKEPGETNAAWLIRRLKVILSQCDLPEPPMVDAAGIDDELAFLDNDTVIPTCVPKTAMWLATALQREIVNAELPVVAEEVLANPTRRDTGWASNVLRMCGRERQAVGAAGLAIAEVSVGWTPTQAQAMQTEAATTTPSAAQAPAVVDRALLSTQLAGCPVPGEKLIDERGEPLFSQTLTKAVAVAVAATTTVEALPKTLSPVFGAARTVTLGGYRAVNITGAIPKRTMMVGALVAAVGGVLALQGSTLFGLTGVITLVIGLYLLALGIWGLRWRVLPILLGITVAGLIIWLCTPSGRHTIFGKDNQHAGWLTHTVEPWLRNSWWAILAVLVGFVVLSATWAFVTEFMHRRRVNKTHAAT